MSVREDISNIFSLHDEISNGIGNFMVEFCKDMSENCNRIEFIGSKELNEFDLLIGIKVDRTLQVWKI